MTVGTVLIGVIVPIGIFIGDLYVNAVVLRQVSAAQDPSRLEVGGIVLMVSSAYLPLALWFVWKLRFFSLLTTMSNVAYEWRG
jgi:hypothetical protein